METVPGYTEVGLPTKQTETLQPAGPVCLDNRGRERYRVYFLAATLVWAMVVGAGMFSLWRYAHQPGDREAAPEYWPSASRIARFADRPILLMFAHPRCPCTRASLREFERLTARNVRDVEAHIVFMNPSKLGDEWFQSDLCRMADAIAGVRVFQDHEGVETERFRARTSGFTLLYSDTGKLVFQGGITASRGHEGGAVGIAALEALIRKSGSPVSQTAVFGCPLQSCEIFASEESSR